MFKEAVMELAIKIWRLIATLLFVAVCWSPAGAQKCLTYGPTISLVGTLHSKVFAGPPNYESIRRGDRKETAIILTLDTPTCATGDDPEDVSLKNIREIQLVVYSDEKWKNNEEWKTVHKRMGKRVVVTGTLFGAHTGHHRTKVLIDVADIRIARSTRKSELSHLPFGFAPINDPNKPDWEICPELQKPARQ